MERLRWREQHWYSADLIAEQGDAWAETVAWHAENAARDAQLMGATTGAGLHPGETFRFVLRLDMHALTPEDIEYLAISDAAEQERRAHAWAEDADGDC